MDVMSVIGLDGITRARRTGRCRRSGEDVRGRHADGAAAARSQRHLFRRQARSTASSRYFSHRRLRDYRLFVAYGVPEAECSRRRGRARIFIAAAALVSLLLIAFAALLTFHLSRRDRREAEMARANRRLQEAQRIGQIGDWDYDLRTGETFWSPQLLAMYERDDRSPTFEEFKAYLDDEGRAAVERAHAEAIRTGEPQEIEYAVRLPSGAESHHQAR